MAASNWWCECGRAALTDNGEVCRRFEPTGITSDQGTAILLAFLRTQIQVPEVQAAIAGIQFQSGMV